jgi:hypothetical protein
VAIPAIVVAARGIPTLPGLIAEILGPVHAIPFGGPRLKS